jgi:hypothetical protein
LQYSSQLRSLTAQAYSKLLEYDVVAEYAHLAIETLEYVENPYLKIEVLQSLTLLAQVQKEWDIVESFMLQCLEASSEHYRYLRFWFTQSQIS